MITVLFIIVLLVAIFTFLLVVLLLYEFWKDSALYKDLIKRRGGRDGH